MTDRAYCLQIQRHPGTLNLNPPCHERMKGMTRAVEQFALSMPERRRLMSRPWSMINGQWFWEDEDGSKLLGSLFPVPDPAIKFEDRMRSDAHALAVHQSRRSQPASH